MQKSLILFDGYELVQDDRFLKLTQDTALLSDFVKVKKGQRVFDIGVGIGSLTILLLVKNEEIYTNGIEILPEAAEIARKNIENCGFSHRAQVITGDLKTVRTKIHYDVCVSNPPYFDLQRGRTAGTDTVAASRAEENADIFDVCRAAKKLLKWGGKFYFCYKPERMDSATKALHENNFAIKRLAFVHQQENKPANLVLFEAAAGGGEWCNIEPPIIVEKDCK